MRSRFFSVSPMYLLTTPRQIDLVEVEPQLAGDDLGGHRLARARTGPANSALTPLPSESLRSKPHSPKHAMAMGDTRADLAQLRQRVSGQHDVVPGIARLDLPR